MVTDCRLSIGMLCKPLPGSSFVAGDGLFELIKPVEFLLTSDLVSEFNMQPLPIEICTVVEQVNLQ